MLLSFIMLGLLLILVVLFMTITVALIPKIVVKSAPKDIQEKVLSRPDSPRWKTILGLILATILSVGALLILIWAGVNAKQNHMSFGQIFARYLILLEGYKIFDMVCFDYLLLTKLHIFQKFFPETIGCKGYEKYGFNLKSQVIKIIVFAMISLILAIILK